MQPTKYELVINRSAGLGDYVDSAMVYCQTENSLGTA